ncbi:MAG TPA: hypothetical protein VIJ07_19260 [Dermatophilaceae bacterium]
MSPRSGISARKTWVLGAAALVVLSLVAVAVIVGGRSSPTPAGHVATRGSSPTTSLPGASSLTVEQQSDLQQSLTRMRAQIPVTPATSAQNPAVSSQARLQPDLYAAAFTAQLLTQDYHASRDQLLAWVQSESAQSTEPLVVGLTPVELRTRLALWSVQDDTGSPAIVPNRSYWAALAERQGYTTVQIQKVTEPVSCADAVAGGQITDPGVTARQVDAEVTLHTTDHGHPITAASSVALTIQLEGPPVRGGYGFVVAAIYNVAGIS